MIGIHIGVYQREMHHIKDQVPTTTLLFVFAYIVNVDTFQDCTIKRFGTYR